MIDVTMVALMILQILMNGDDRQKMEIGDRHEVDRKDSDGTMIIWWWWWLRGWACLVKWWERRLWVNMVKMLVELGVVDIYEVWWFYNINNLARVFQGFFSSESSNYSSIGLLLVSAESDRTKNRAEQPNQIRPCTFGSTLCLVFVPFSVFNPISCWTSGPDQDRDWLNLGFLNFFSFSIGWLGLFVLARLLQPPF